MNKFGRGAGVWVVTVFPWKAFPSIISARQFSTPTFVQVMVLSTTVPEDGQVGSVDPVAQLPEQDVAWKT